MTELEIINSMLAVQGESKVTSAESLHPSVVNARDVLQRVNTAVQSSGWFFNTERNRPLHPDISGKVLVPEGTLKLEASVERGQYIVRGDVLYDIKNFTSIIGKTVLVNRIARIDYSDMPESAAEYIRAYAVYEFFVQEDGEGTKHQALYEARKVARARLYTEHVQWQRSNQLHSPRSIAARLPFRTGYFNGGL